MSDAILLNQFSVTEIEPDPQRLRSFEKRPTSCTGHFAFEKTVDFGVVLHPPARKKGSQRQFWKNHDIAATSLRFAHQFEQPRHYLLPRLTAGYRSQLGSGNIDEAFHWYHP